MTDCACGFDSEQSRCIDGSVYGPCVSEYCGGVCEFVGDCDCTCHQPPSDPANGCGLPA
jgi:hypothetical protein